MSFERRISIALLISGLIWIGFDFFLPPAVAPTPDQPGVGVDAEVQVGEGGGHALDAGADGGVGGNDGPEAARQGELDDAGAVTVEHREVRNDLLALKVTNRAPGHGGIIEEVDLLAEQFAGHETATNPLDLDGAATLEVGFADESTDFRIPRDQVFSLTEERQDGVFELVHRGPDVEVRQTLTLLEGYQAKLVVEVKNRTGQEQRHRMHIRTRVGLSGEDSRYNLRRGLCRTVDDFEYEDSSDVEDGPITYAQRVQWAGVDNRYFTTLVVPGRPFADCEMGLSEDGGHLVARLGSSVTTLSAGGVHRYEVGLYIGAKEIERLQAFSAVQPADEIHLEEAIDWGYLGGLSEWLGRILLALMRFFHERVGVWGWSIVLVTVAIKLVTLPLTLKQMASMKAMKRIQPKIAALKEKYGDDRVKQGQEMQALFAREGVNPLAGCLPVFVQMPVYIALYAMLGAAVELVHEPFLWLPDLTKQDPYFGLPVGIGLVMVAQNRMMPTSGDEMQAKLMRWIMPVGFAAFMLFLPSGLALYIFVNICLSVVQTAIQVGRNTDDDTPEAQSKAPKAKNHD